MFKVNNRDTRLNSMILFSSVSIVTVEQVNVRLAVLEYHPRFWGNIYSS